MSGTGPTGSMSYLFASMTTRSSSDKSNSALRLEDHITVDQFSQLMQTFYPHGWKGPVPKMAKLTKQSFKVAFSKVLDIPDEDERLELLCNKVRN